MFRIATTTFAMLLPLLVQAEVQPETDVLLKAMQFPELLEVMQEEGRGYGENLEAELFPNRGGDAWLALVERIYDPVRIYEEFAKGFQEAASAETIAAAHEFFSSERGQRIVELEVSGRRALLDDSVEEAANDAFLTLQADNDPRVDLVGQFIEANDLVETNVMGALNANYAFYTGLMDGNALPRQLSEEQALADVWAQEEDIRDDTTLWVYSYLLLAYQPLSDDDLEAYIAMSKSKPGRALNSALFAAFDEMFVDISRDLGLAASRFMSGQDI